MSVRTPVSNYTNLTRKFPGWNGWLHLQSLTSQLKLCEPSPTRRSCSSVEWFGSHPGPAQVPNKLKHTWWRGKGKKHTNGPTSPTILDCWMVPFHVILLGCFCWEVLQSFEWSFGRFGFHNSLTHACTNTQTRTKLHRLLGSILVQFRKHQKRKWTINVPKWGEPPTL